MGTCPVVAPWVTGGKERDRRFLKCIYAASHHGNELRRKCVEGQRAFSMAFNSMCHMCIVFRDSRREKNILGCFFFSMFFYSSGECILDLYFFAEVEAVQ